jgi:hypothetical protein
VVLTTREDAKMTKQPATIQSLRKDFKAYGKREFCYDVYSDRVNFHGFQNENLYRNFFETVRGVMIDCDRSGFSISKDDAVQLGIPMSKSSYVVNCKDLRHKGY